MNLICLVNYVLEESVLRSLLSIMKPTANDNGTLRTDLKTDLPSAGVVVLLVSWNDWLRRSAILFRSGVRRGPG